MMLAGGVEVYCLILSSCGCRGCRVYTWVVGQKGRRLVICILGSIGGLTLMR
jgi:hypothetical protein